MQLVAVYFRACVFIGYDKILSTSTAFEDFWKVVRGVKSPIYMYARDVANIVTCLKEQIIVVEMEQSRENVALVSPGTWYITESSNNVTSWLSVAITVIAVKPNHTSPLIRPMSRKTVAHGLSCFFSYAHWRPGDTTLQQLSTWAMLYMLVGALYQ